MFRLTSWAPVVGEITHQQKRDSRTSHKFNIDIKNGHIHGESPFPNHHFGYPCWFLGCVYIGILGNSLRLKDDFESIFAGCFERFASIKWKLIQIAKHLKTVMRGFPARNLIFSPKEILGFRGLTGFSLI